jgi:hypothetical protein
MGLILSPRPIPTPSPRCAAQLHPVPLSSFLWCVDPGWSAMCAADVPPPGGTLTSGLLCNKYIYDIYDIYLYALCYYMCCLLWRIYEMHPDLFLKSPGVTQLKALKNQYQ